MTDNTYTEEEAKEKCCSLCKAWTRDSKNMFEGTCGKQHRHSRFKMPDGSYALLDSFEPTETRYDNICGAFERK